MYSMRRILWSTNWKLMSNWKVRGDIRFMKFWINSLMCVCVCFWGAFRIRTFKFQESIQETRFVEMYEWMRFCLLNPTWIRPKDIFSYWIVMIISCSFKGRKIQIESTSPPWTRENEAGACIKGWEIPTRWGLVSSFIFLLIKKWWLLI